MAGHRLPDEPPGTLLDAFFRHFPDPAAAPADLQPGRSPVAAMPLPGWQKVWLGVPSAGSGEVPLGLRAASFTCQNLSPFTLYLSSFDPRPSPDSFDYVVPAGASVSGPLPGAERLFYWYDQTVPLTGSQVPGAVCYVSDAPGTYARIEAGPLPALGKGPTTQFAAYAESYRGQPLATDPASGYYSTYGLSAITFMHRAQRVTVTNITADSMYYVRPYTDVQAAAPPGTWVSTNPTLTSVTGEDIPIYPLLGNGGENLALPPGKPVHIAGPVALLYNALGARAAGGNTDFNMGALLVVAEYDPGDVGFTAQPSSSETNLTTQSLLDTLPVYGANAILPNTATIPASGKGAFSLSAVGASSCGFGLQEQAWLLLSVNQTYSADVYPGLDVGGMAVCANPISVASSHPPTAAWSFSGTWLDQSAHYVGVSGSFDAYDLTRSVGNYPSYVVVVTNESTSAAASVQAGFVTLNRRWLQGR